MKHLETLLSQVAMSKDEYGRLVDMLDREPTEVELGMTGALWSEHCGYKHSKPLFHHFPTTGPHVLTEAGAENAGAIDIGDGWVVVFKIESHNHPSALEPYEGAATGVGGILRDIFAMGMRPVALLNSLRFGPLAEAHNRSLLRGVVSGIGGYGNCVGVPTVGGEIQMHTSYSGNPLVNAMCVGVGLKTNLLSAVAEGEGNPLVLVGADTGRDGIHGATFASVELDEDSASRRPAVQVGHPFLEKLLMEACVGLAENHSDWIVGLQDLGAAGLTSSAVEAADRGNSGIDIDVTLVPRRAENMSAYEVMLSESQERMLVIPHRKYLDEVIDYFESWEINATEIGIVTSNGQVTIREKDVIVASMPVDIMTNPPMYTNDAMIDPIVELLAREDLSLEPDIDPVMATDVLFDLLESENLSSRRWVYQQYDHQVLNNTVVKPGGDAAVLRIKELKQGLAVSTDCNGRAVYLNPQVGAALAVAEAARNVIATGARPVAVTDCLNFGNPEKSEVAYQLEKSIIGLSEASRVFETPVISGNASLYNETPDGQIMPTPTIGMLGVISDVTNRLTISPKVGNRVFLIGGLLEQSANTLAASEFQWLRTGRMAGSPSIDLKLAREIGDLVLLMHDEGLLSAAHDVGDGGIAVALIEMSFASGYGFRSKILDLGERLDAALFGEAPSRFLVATDQPDLVISLAGKYSIPVVELGEVETDNNFEFGPISVDLDIAYEKWNLGLNRVVEQDFTDEGSGDF